MDYIALDKKNIWHPFTQALTADDPINIVKGEGLYLIDSDGNRYMDLISSWWVNVHGHSHPYLSAKLKEQFDTLDHVIFAGFTHPKAVELSERLLSKLPAMTRMFFSDNGSTAVEVGMKMAVQYYYNKGESRNRILAIDGAYHGDTFGAMSAGGRNAFNAPFDALMFDVDHLDFPFEADEARILGELKTYLEKHGSETACFIYEPLVQGAAGMRIYRKEFLNEAIKLCKSYDVLCIADEVMTGFYRTGKLFSSMHMEEEPDIMCMSKGITGGTLPLGVTVCKESIYDAYLSDDYHKTFFHGHSFTGNPTTCAISCASLDLLESEETLANIAQINTKHEAFAVEVAKIDSVVEVKVQGTIISIERRSEEATGYFNPKRNEVLNHFLSKGMLVRPLGNIIYLIPPYCITAEELDKAYAAIADYLSN